MYKSITRDRGTWQGITKSKKNVTSSSGSFLVEMFVGISTRANVRSQLNMGQSIIGQ